MERINIYKKMGSDICHVQNKQLGFSNEDPLKALQQKQKSLSFKIKQFLEKQQPYMKQLSQKELTVKNIGKCLYHGQINSFGKPNGIGKLYRSDGSLFIGKFNNGLADGMGYLIFSNGDLYQGFFVKDMPDDPKGKLISRSSVYYGGYQNNLLHGQGQFVSQSVNFKGQFKNGKISYGLLKWKNSKGNFQNQYKGFFDQSEKFTGNGVLKTESGVYEGQFEDGLKNGKGKYIHKSGWKYEGYYVNDQKQGWGTLYDKKSKIKYEGRWQQNIPHGVGKQFDNKGNILQDQFIQGIPSQCLISV